MKMKLFAVALAFVTCVIPEYRALAQANVIETEPVTLYVDAAHGANSNSGSSTKPFATIQAALSAASAQNRKGLGVKILVNRGIYREAVVINHFPSAAALTVEAATPGTAMIDGANVLTDYYSISKDVYAFPWTDTVKGCSLPSGWYAGMPPVVLANEMLFVDGTPMTQVMSTGALVPGTFYVNPSYKQIQVNPPAGTNMTSALVEVAARRSTLTVNGADNLVVRGMVLQHGASCMNTTAATVNSSTNVLFDSNVVQWNNWSGLGFNSSKQTTVENTIASNNGGVGLAGHRDLESLWQNNETDYNNWRGAMVGLYDFGQGGTKLMFLHGASVVGHNAYNNQAQGLWFDSDNQNIKVSGATLVGNIVAALQLEANKGPISVTSSSFCSGSGVQILETTGITMTDNLFYGNGGTSFQNGQLFLAGRAKGRPMTDWQTGVTTNLITGKMTFSNNTLVATNSTQYVFNTYLSGSDWTAFADSLNSNNNSWYNPVNAAAFGLPSNKKVNLAGWQTKVAQDESSTWSPLTAAPAICTAPEPAFPDFQLQAHNAASYVGTYTMTKGKLAIPVQLRSFGFGAVKLSAYGLPAGVHAAFSAASLTSGSTVLTLTAASSSKAQRIPITIFGISGNRVHSVTLWVAVTPA